MAHASEPRDEQEQGERDAYCRETDATPTVGSHDRLVISELDGYAVREADPEDFVAIQKVEVGAAQRFRAVGLGFIAEAPPLPFERLAEFLRSGGLHVLTHMDIVVGVSAHCLLDEMGYLAELDVLPTHAGRRLGGRLLKQVVARICADRADSLWLTTYRDVPWNGPYYRRIGFEESLPPAGSELAKRLRNEQEGPLGMQQRIAMVKRLAPPCGTFSRDAS